MSTCLAALLVLASSAINTPMPALPPVGTEPPRLEVGDRVPPFETVGIDGTPHRVEFREGRATVLLFFLSSCSTCHRMIPVWNDAYPRRGENVEVLGVIVDEPPPAFFEVMPVSFPVIRSPGRGLLDRYKVHKVPVTVRIEASGVVEDVGHGLLDPIRLGEILH